MHYMLLVIVLMKLKMKEMEIIFGVFVKLMIFGFLLMLLQDFLMGNYLFLIFLEKSDLKEYKLEALIMLLCYLILFNVNFWELEKIYFF